MALAAPEPRARKRRAPTTPVRCPGCGTTLQVADDYDADTVVEVHSQNKCSRPDPVIIERLRANRRQPDD